MLWKFHNNFWLNIARLNAQIQTLWGQVAILIYFYVKQIVVFNRRNPSIKFNKQIFMLDLRYSIHYILFICVISEAILSDIKVDTLISDKDATDWYSK